jgi:tRNA threonylcarbamoyl adenosine modification protein (Sua5/YciO/YrdC/YwlC family)
MVHLPVQQNLHRDGILAVTQVPAPDVDAATTAAQAVALAGRLAESMQYVGVLCVEFFVLADGRWWPTRWRRARTTRATTASTPATCRSSTCRCARWLGLPLVAPRQHSAAVMLNLLGDLWFDRRARRAAAHSPTGPRCWPCPACTCTCTARPRPRRGRKMGHLTVTAATPARRAAWPCRRRAAGPAGLLTARPCPSSTVTTPPPCSAAEHLAAGQLVAFATETVYGLGARADDDAAVAGIFAAKGRPADHPLIVHVADARRCAHFATCRTRPQPSRLMAALLARAADPDRAAPPGVGTAAAGGQDSIGLRMPAHPVALALLQHAPAWACAGGRAQRQPLRPRQPHHGGPCGRRVRPRLLVLDGGACDVGIESAIVDCTREQPALLRPGAAHELFAVLRELDAAGVGTIWVEQPPPDPAWDGVRDRLQRAAA